MRCLCMCRMLAPSDLVGVYSGTIAVQGLMFRGPGVGFGFGVEDRG
jgi:hypothetical protein